MKFFWMTLTAGFLLLVPSFGQDPNLFQPVGPAPPALWDQGQVPRFQFGRDLSALAEYSKGQGLILEAQFNPQFGTPQFLHGVLSAPSPERPEVIAQAFVAQRRVALKLGSLQKIDVVKVTRDDLGFAHVKMRPSLNGLEIWPAEFTVHIDRSGVVKTFNGSFREGFNLKTDPSLTALEATQNAVTEVDPHTEHTVQTELLIYDWKVAQPLLVYRVHLQAKGGAPLSEDVFIDAHSGEVINRINYVCTGIHQDLSKAPAPSSGELDEQHDHHHAQLKNSANKMAVNCTVFPTRAGDVSATVSGFNDGTNIFLVNTSKPMFPGQIDPNTLAGTIYVLESNHQNQPQGLAIDPNKDGTFNDSPESHAAGAVAYNLSTTYDWLLQTFKRNSFDGNGSAIRIFVNYRADPNQGFDNAFWNGRELVFGDGGSFTHNWAFSLDFATHEICHAITSSSANLVYQFQPGALNEAFSDMYALAQDTRNWLLGEDVVNNNFPAPALRSAENPNQGLAPGQNGWQPKHMNEFANLQANVDNGGVHINSGIINHAFYLMSNQIGRDQSIQIMQRALTNYLNRNSEFLEARAAIERSAGDLYGENSNQKTVVSNAFAAVGIGGQGTQPPPTTNSATTLYYPMAANFDIFQLSFKNTLYVSNVSDQTVNGTATWYNATGGQTFRTNITLEPHRTIVGTSDPGEQWVKIEADGPIVGAFQHMNADGTAWSMIPATPYIGNGMFIPHIATNPNFWTVGAVANVRDTASNIIYVDNQAQAWTVNANQSGHATAFDFLSGVYGTYPDVSGLGGLWGFFMNYDLQQDKVLEQNMVGAEIFGRKDVNQAAGLLLDATSGRNLIFTHVAANTATFWTGYSIVNLDGNESNVRILAFDDKGATKADNIVKLPGFGKLLAVTGDNLIPSGTSWFLVLGLAENTNLAGMELFITNNLQSIAGFQVSPQLASKAYFPFVLSGSTGLPQAFQGLPETFTGISIINPNQQAVTLDFKLYNHQGGVVSKSLSLDPGNKLLGLLRDIFGVSNFYGHVEINASLPVAGFSLSGFLNGQELAANPMVVVQ